MSIAWVYEWDYYANNNSHLASPIGRGTYAWEEYWTSYIWWNYNWKVAKVQSWSTMYVLAVPSIISWDEDSKDLISLINSKKLVFNKSHILPLSYWKQTVFSERLPTGNIVNTWSMVVYSWNLNGLQDKTKQQELINNLKTAYLDTEVKDQWTIKWIIDNPSLFVAQTLIHNSVNDRVKVTAKNTPVSASQDISCTWLIGDISEYTSDNIDNSLSSINLCDNINELPLNSLVEKNLAEWWYDVYWIYLEAWIEYNVKLDEDDSVDKVLFLFNDSWVRQDYDDWEEYRDDDPEDWNYTPSTSGVYYFVVLWYSDDEYWDYSISINAIFNTSFSCVTQPNYHAYFVSWNVTVEWTAWQNTDSWEACYYSCIGWYSWDDCNIPPTPPDYSDCLSMTDENVENLNTTLWISQSREQWCKTEWISIDYTNNDFNWIPSEIWYLKKLKNLGLIWLGLSSLPEQFSYLTCTNLVRCVESFHKIHYV